MSESPFHHLNETDIRHQLRGFPVAAVDAVLELQRSGDVRVLQTAILQIVGFYLPDRTKGPRDLLSEPGSARLREDLGVDSLTFSEAAFKLEEIFEVRIENTELTQLQTIDDLIEFAERKLGLQPVEVS